MKINMLRNNIAATLVSLGLSFASGSELADQGD